MKTYLLKGDTFWAVKSTSSLESWMWKKLLKYRDMAASFHRIEVRNGLDTSFWYDAWSDMGRLSELVGDRGSIDMGISLNASVSSALTRRRRRHRYRYDLYNMIEEALDKQRQKISVGSDIPVWKYSMDAFKQKFVTRSTWSLIRSSSLSVNWHESVWFSNATPKFAFMTWLAMHNRLTTGDIMLTWNINLDASCTLCRQHLETKNHLFFECSYSQDVWTNLLRELLLSRFSYKWQDIMALLADRSQTTLKLFLLRYSFQVIIYFLWRERNNRRHGSLPILPNQLIKMIDRQIRNQCLLMISKKIRHHEGVLQLWLSTR